jgi:hypothetical protein
VDFQDAQERLVQRLDLLQLEEAQDQAMKDQQKILQLALMAVAEVDKVVILGDVLELQL